MWSGSFRMCGRGGCPACPLFPVTPAFAAPVPGRFTALPEELPLAGPPGRVLIARNPRNPG
ncbi:hypothetical protein CGUA_10400 [Corynebacterium guangdongense]|uniref:Uncharacterized protein n=1 Tax=Corynebacterium guangdongense TaxID=1783348 RepID=A0ABU1ZYS1_9CORY|nr:hypothetical protein [Corynebacterium guangdongense]WJZ18634.1 hypothetical protein CGUA_10400 [Corynebacterium guangdongense]